MAVITATTFDPLKARCNVRLQQGVPIVDADWNELDDIRKFEMRAYLKWFVGDGIPDGDSFRIEALGDGVFNDFIIHSGADTPPANTSNYDQAMRFSGRAIVDGLDVIIPRDTKYRDQLLFAGPRFGLPQITPMPASPASNVAAYLDVWERLVTAQDDPSLVLSGIGTESCARMLREWCVRTRTASADVPKPGDSDFISGHSYYLLAILNYPNATTNQVDVTDRRRTKLALSTFDDRLRNMENLLKPRFGPSQSQFSTNNSLPGLKISLFGANLNIGSNIQVFFGNTPAKVVDQLRQPTALNVEVPIVNPSGAVRVTINTDGGSVTSDDKFTVLAPPPIFETFDLSQGQPLTTVVTMGGHNLNFQPVSVTFDPSVGTPAAAQIVGPPTETTIKATVPQLPSGSTVKITITTGGGKVTSTSTFTVL
jgi:hypothetical protein